MRRISRLDGRSHHSQYTSLDGFGQVLPGGGELGQIRRHFGDCSTIVANFLGCRGQLADIYS